MIVLVSYCAHSYFYVIAFDAVSALPVFSVSSVSARYLTDRSPQTYPTAGLVFAAIIVRIRLFGTSIKSLEETPINPNTRATGLRRFVPGVHQLQSIAANIHRDELSTDRDCDNQTTTTFSKADDAKA